MEWYGLWLATRGHPFAEKRAMLVCADRLQHPKYACLLFLALERVLAVSPTITNIYLLAESYSSGSENVSAGFTSGGAVQAEYVTVV